MANIYLSCKSPKCNSTPKDIEVGTARALFEYRLQYDPKYIFHLPCTKCKKVTQYTYDQIVSLLPPEKRPQTLAHDHFWAYMLFDLKLWKSKDHRAQLGARVLVQRLTSEPNGAWYGTLKSASPYAPTLMVGNYIKGQPRGNFEICLFVIEDGHQVPIPKPLEIPKSISFGLFISPKDNNSELLCANIFCSNPSCHHIFSTITYTKFSALIGQEQLDEEAYDELTVLPTLKLQCPVCGTSRVIDETSFDNLYKET
jgi:hypothetical protein